MSHISIDIGNTLSKVGIFNEGILLNNASFKNEDLQGIKAYFLANQAEHIILSSVAKSSIELINCLKDLAPIIELSHETSLPFSNNYQTPQTLGMDRVAGIAGAIHFYPETNCLVIDAGTCITYDFVSKEGIYQGGSISPGLYMRLKAMHEFTGKLPLLNYQEIEDWIGKDTQTSMLTGVIWGMVNEINGFIARYGEAFGDLKVIFTGGDAPKFVKHLKNNVFAEPNLLLFGLNKILKINV
ncbi:MAG: type III pantothenate kinase [Bacteroidetes bacterium]|nr:type III pantothenate kinase [Bacteroidota bacterium]